MHLFVDRSKPCTLIAHNDLVTSSNGSIAAHYHLGSFLPQSPFKTSTLIFMIKYQQRKLFNFDKARQRESKSKPMSFKEKRFS